MAGGEQSLAVGHCAVDTGRSGDTSALPRCCMKHRTPLVRCPAHLLYEGSNGGRPAKDHRPIVNGLLWLDHVDARWRDISEHYGPWQTRATRVSR